MTANKFFRITVDEHAAEPGAPNPAKVISGDPQFRTWEVEPSNGEVSAGVWECTPGKWHFTNDYFEYCNILSGVSIVTEDGGEPQTVRAGDSFVLRTGFSGTWEVVETTRKDYVVTE